MIAPILCLFKSKRLAQALGESHAPAQTYSPFRRLRSGAYHRSERGAVSDRSKEPGRSCPASGHQTAGRPGDCATALLPRPRNRDEEAGRAPTGLRVPTWRPHRAGQSGNSFHAELQCELPNPQPVSQLFRPPGFLPLDVEKLLGGSMPQRRPRCLCVPCRPLSALQGARSRHSSWRARLPCGEADRYSSGSSKFFTSAPRAPGKSASTSPWFDGK